MKEEHHTTYSHNVVTSVLLKSVVGMFRTPNIHQNAHRNSLVKNTIMSYNPKY